MQSWLARLTSKRNAWRWRGSKPRPNASNSNIDYFIICSICNDVHPYDTERLITPSLQ